jgi:hypothetical protein
MGGACRTRPERRRSSDVKIILLALAAALGIAVVADVTLDRIGFSSAERQSVPGNVRLD